MHVYIGRILALTGAILTLLGYASVRAEEKGPMGYRFVVQLNKPTSKMYLFSIDWY